jgi:hypothetical protein
MRLPRLVLPMALLMVLSVGAALVVTFSAEAALQGDKKALVSATLVKTKVAHDLRGYKAPSHDVHTAR